MISFCVFIFPPFPLHISVLLLIPPSSIALFCSLGPSLQRMTTSRSTLTTCWPTLPPRSPSVRWEVSADSRLRPPKPKRWWLWWTKLRTSTYKVSRRFVSDWQTRLNHKFNNKTLFSIFPPQMSTCTCRANCFVLLSRRSTWILQTLLHHQTFRFFFLSFFSLLWCQLFAHLQTPRSLCVFTPGSWGRGHNTEWHSQRCQRSHRLQRFGPAAERHTVSAGPGWYTLHPLQRQVRNMRLGVFDITMIFIKTDMKHNEGDAKKQELQQT